MSQHSSLKNAEGSRKHRNVLKRYERIRKMQETDKWNDRGSIYKLPKIKNPNVIKKFDLLGFISVTNIITTNPNTYPTNSLLWIKVKQIVCKYAESEY